jgi:aromatic ring-opening dioxygenase catalytic subunit (LigB family)
MAQIVFAAGVPHAPGLVGLFDAAPGDVRDVVRTLYDEVSAALRAARPDVLIVFANDHLANSRIRSYPDFLIGMAAAHSGPYEWFKEWIGCRDYTVAGNPPVAEALFAGMTRRGRRMFADRANLKFDDNISVPVVMTDLDHSGITLVPVLQNCTVPPVPDQHACYATGQALREIIEHDLPADMRVALLGSGGLSHEPGGARYFFIDREFDRWFLELMASGDHERVLRELTIERMEQSGSGGTSELLAWVVILGAIGACKGVQSSYALHTDFKCGIGGVTWDVSHLHHAEREGVAS